MSSSSRYIEKRLRYFEEVNSYTLETLEMATSLSEYRQSVNRLETVDPILQDGEQKIRELMPFDAVSFYLVNETTNEFESRLVRPLELGGFVEEEVEHCIDSGLFAWALTEKRPVLATSRGGNRRFVLHVIATRSRTRGMFVGLLPEETLAPDIKLSLLSLLLMNMAGSLESFYLYRMVRQKSGRVMDMARYEELFRLTPEPMEVIDRRGRIVDCNDACCAMLACSRDHVVGRPRTHFFSRESTERYRKELAAGLKKEGVCEGALELVGADGGSFRVWRQERAITKAPGGSVARYRVLDDESE